MDCSTTGFPVLHYRPEFSQAHVHWVSDVIHSSHPCLPLLLLPSIFPSIRVFSSDSAFPIRGPKEWSFSFSISPSNEYSRLISFRIDWFDLLEIKRTFKGLLQHHGLKAPIIWCSTFFMVQLSYLYLTTGKTIALTIHLVPWIKHVPGLLEWVIFSQAWAVCSKQRGGTGPTVTLIKSA